MNVRAVFVDGDPARWRRDDNELDDHAAPEVSQRPRLQHGDRVRRRPGTIGDAEWRRVHPHRRRHAGGRPADVAASWYPVNDHPLDKASYTFRIAVPRGLQAIANGELEGVEQPRALDRVDVGRARADGVLPDDGLDRRVRHRRRTRPTASSTRTRSIPTCSGAPAPRTGRQFAISKVGRAVLQAADADDRRPRRRREAVVLGRSATPSSTGTSSSSRRTPSVRTTGRRCPTSRATRTRTPACCLFYLTPSVPGALPDARTPTVAVTRRARPARWNAISGASDGYEQWVVDLTPYEAQADRDLAQLRQRHLSSTSRACSSTTSSVRAARARRRSRDGNARRLDDAGAPAGTDPNENTGSSAPPRTRRDPGRRRAPDAGPPAGDHPVPVGPLRAVPVLVRGRDRRRLPGARLRAREPDAARSTTGASSKTGPTRRRRIDRRRPRARPPVDRRLPGARRRGSTSGSTRASRPTASGSGASARAVTRRRQFFDDLASIPADDPSGRWRSATRARTGSSTARSTTAAR